MATAGVSVVREVEGSAPDSQRWFVGDTEPALIFRFPKAEEYEDLLPTEGEAVDAPPSLFPQFLKALASIGGAVDYYFYLNLKTMAGETLVDDGTALFGRDVDGIPAFQYDWDAGDLAAAGTLRGQFSAAHKGTGKRLYADRFRLSVRSRV